MSAITCLMRAQVLVGFCALAGLVFPAREACSDAAEARWRSAETLTELIGLLELWLDQNTRFPPREANPSVSFIHPAEARAVSSLPMHGAGRIRGLYDPAADRIYLVLPWRPDDVQDVGTLVHELAHRRQTLSARWRCGAEEELSAYRTQEIWLSGQGAHSRTDWFSVSLASGCLRDDIHP